MDAINNEKSLRNNDSKQHPSLPSPHHSHSSSSSSNSSNDNNNELPLTPTPSPPNPITKSESTNPYPTTFVQVDTSSFKQVVQMLTGSPETARHASSTYSKSPTEVAPSNSKNRIPPIKTMPKKQQQQSGFKLYERRNSLKNLKPLLSDFTSNPSGFSSKNPDVLSPSTLDFPSLVLNPSVASGSSYQCGNGSLDLNLDIVAEDQAIKEKGFFLHPSTTNTSRDAEPRLLPLFPTTFVAEEQAIKEKGFFLHPSATNTFKDAEPRLLPLFPTTSVVEEQAIKEKGFFLHPSATNTSKDAEPRLLPLFPTTSPNASDPPSST